MLKTGDKNKASYHQDDDYAYIFRVLPELVSRNHLGIVNNSKGKDEHTEQLHHHGCLKRQKIKLTQHMKRPCHTTTF